MLGSAVCCVKGKVYETDSARQGGSKFCGDLQHFHTYKKDLLLSS